MSVSGEEFSKVRQLSDADLLHGLSGLLGVCRKATARVIAFLCEVEERRLHLLAGFSSMFAYCVGRLGMSEDEAGRRLDVAWLTRRFPGLFARLEEGDLSLSVAALLKPHLTTDNQVALIAAVSGKTVAQARDVLAAWFPRPDVPSIIRRLPTRQPVVPSSSDMPPSARVVDAIVRQLDLSSARSELPVTSATPAPETPDRASNDAGRSTVPLAPPPSLGPPHRPARAVGARTIEPLAPARYKVQFTADAELKRRLELARDLMRHALPGGELADIVHRAIDLLIEQQMKRRFGTSSRPRGTDVRKAASPRPAPAADPAPEEGRASAPPAAPGEPTPARKRPPDNRHIPHHVRRAVLERDDGRCTWRGPDGQRCDCRAWLEYDHITPRALGGSDEVANIRLLCRAHNRLAAEQAYGRARLDRIIKRQVRARPSSPRGHGQRDAVAQSVDR